MSRICAAILAAISAVFIIVPLSVDGASVDLNQHGLTGSWYDPAKNGQGVELEVFPDLVAPGTSLVQGAWFTFDSESVGGADRERWYTFNGNGKSGSADVPVTINISNLLGSGAVDLVVPQSQLKLQLISPPVRGAIL